ncbi:MAG: septation protein SpoVG family protein [Planctomycetales bacterium]|nr:septation protein SpoVG family protein [Planctomycetales bacterium]
MQTRRIAAADGSGSGIGFDLGIVIQQMHGGNAVDITEVRIKLMEESEDRLRAFCSITFDNCFVVRDLKIIEGTHGPFVAMPSRKLTQRCGRCGNKNYIRSNYCSNCGSKTRDKRNSSDEEYPNKLYADVAHPINQHCRDLIQNYVVQEYHLELERAKLPGYLSRYDDAYESTDTSHTDSPRNSSLGASAVPPPHLNMNSSPASGAKERSDQVPPEDQSVGLPKD